MWLLFMLAESKSQKLGRREELCAGSGCAAWVGVQGCYGDYSCVCSIVESDGSALVDCGSCLALNGDVDDSVSIAQLSGLCDPTADCVNKPACQTVIEAYEECPNSPCFCTSALPALPACASCYAYVNITYANVLSSAISNCSSQLYGSVETSEVLTTDFVSSPSTTPSPEGSANVATTAATSPAPATTSKTGSGANAGRTLTGLVTPLMAVAFVVGLAALQYQ
jgi:hypothetical protein